MSFSSCLSSSYRLFEAAYRHFVNTKDKDGLKQLMESYMGELSPLPARAPIDTVPKGQRTVAFAFDIDGVLVRSKTPLPGATEILKVLQRNNIPFIFLTNGGGSTEKDHVGLVSSRLSVPGLLEEQFVQSHSPFRDLVPILAEKNILVLGGVGNKIREVALAYGFNSVLTPSDIYRSCPDIYPFLELTQDHHKQHGLDKLPLDTDGRLQISAILVWSSPRDWGYDLQLCLDLLLSEKGYLGTVSPLNGNVSLPNNGYCQDSQPSIYFCNPDLTWATSFHHPRAAQGSFRAALEGIWAARTANAQLSNQILVGKPTEATYIYAERVLQAYHRQLNRPSAKKIDTIYMIGDNPASDIQGANNFVSPYGTLWKSVLVESGIHVAGTTPDHLPTHTAEGVKEAVELALREEGLEIVREE